MNATHELHSCATCCAWDDGECLNVVSINGRAPDLGDWCPDHEPSDASQAFRRTPPGPMSIEFRDVLTTHHRLVETLGINHPDTMRAMNVVIYLAPDWLRDEMHAMASEMGLIPEASGYLEDGSPVYLLDDLAARLGVSPQDAKATLDRSTAELEEQGIQMDRPMIDSAVIHRKQ